MYKKIPGTAGPQPGCTKITHKKTYKKVHKLHARRHTKNTWYCLFAPSGNSNDNDDDNNERQ